MGAYVEIGTIRVLDRLPEGDSGKVPLHGRVAQFASKVADVWGQRLPESKAAREDALADIVEAVATLAAAEGLDLAAGLDRRRAANAAAGLVSADDGIDEAHRPWHMPLGIVDDDQQGLVYELLFDMSGRQEFWVRRIDGGAYGLPVHMPVTWQRVSHWVESGLVRCSRERLAEVRRLVDAQKQRDAETAARFAAAEAPSEDD